jgi:hypothetical protein
VLLGMLKPEVYAPRVTIIDHNRRAGVASGIPLCVYGLEAFKRRFSQCPYPRRWRLGRIAT